MAGLEDALRRYLREAARTPFAWGRTDCCLFLADWVMAVRGIDPAQPLRGRYISERGAERWLRRHGGLVATVGLCAAGAGLAPTPAPRAGDIGVVRAMGPDGKPREAGAICAGGRWMARTPGGLAGFRATPLAAWRV